MAVPPIPHLRWGGVGMDRGRRDGTGGQEMARLGFVQELPLSSSSEGYSQGGEEQQGGGVPVGFHLPCDGHPIAHSVSPSLKDPNCPSLIAIHGWAATYPSNRPIHRTPPIKDGGMMGWDRDGPHRTPSKMGGE